MTRTPKKTRRRLLRMAGAATVAGVTGCMENGGDEEQDGEDGGEGGEEGEGEGQDNEQEEGG